MRLDTIETHKFLPNGIWEEFYCYNNSPTQHKMRITLLFSDNKVSGSGIDDIYRLPLAKKNLEHNTLIFDIYEQSEICKRVQFPYPLK